MNIQLRRYRWISILHIPLCPSITVTKKWLPEWEVESITYTENLTILQASTLFCALWIKKTPSFPLLECQRKRTLNWKRPEFYPSFATMHDFGDFIQSSQTRICKMLTMDCKTSTIPYSLHILWQQYTSDEFDVILCPVPETFFNVYFYLFGCTRS